MPPTVNDNIHAMIKEIQSREILKNKQIEAYRTLVAKMIRVISKLPQEVAQYEPQNCDEAIRKEIDRVLGMIQLELNTLDKYSDDQRPYLSDDTTKLQTISQNFQGNYKDYQDLNPIINRVPLLPPPGPAAAIPQGQPPTFLSGLSGIFGPAAVQPGPAVRGGGTKKRRKSRRRS